jgi:hypothetical protein
MDYHRGAGVEVELQLLNRDLSLTAVYLVGNNQLVYHVQNTVLVWFLAVSCPTYSFGEGHGLIIIPIKGGLW